MVHFYRFLIGILLLANIPASGQKGESVLWQVTGNGLPKASYLFGTNHIASVELLDRFPKVMQTANTCEFAMFEKGGEQFGSAQHAEIHTPPLDSVFNKEEYALVDSFFTASPYGSIRPHNDDADLQTMAQVVLMLKQEKTATQDSSFDDIINDRLGSANKRILQLDETAEMASRIAGTNWRQVADVIVVLIKNDVTEQEESSEIYDADMYSAFLRNPMKLDQEGSDYIKSVTLARHTLWIPKIETTMKQGAAFIAVGLAHLQYRTGLIQLLRGKGYKVEPVAL